MARWAIDLGTTNTVVAVEEHGSVRTVDLPALHRTLPVEQPPLIPSALQVDEERRGFWIFRRRVRHVVVGQQALSRNYDGRSPSFAQGFKRDLAALPHRTVLRVGDQTGMSAREAARLFLGELLAALQRDGFAPPQDLTIPAPVDYFEQYRAELQAMARAAGVRRFRSLDEPVAAALGYGISVARDQTLLVVDFGGGTLNLAAARLGLTTASTGRSQVLAKHMLRVGGDDVDYWLAGHLFGGRAVGLPEWHRDVLWETMWLKERVCREGAAEARWSGLTVRLTRDTLEQLLEARGLFELLRGGLEEIRLQLREGSGTEPDQVLLVGGSTQLPGIPAVVDAAFPNAVVRHDPEYVFSSVALGAARFAGGVPVEDFVYHDYALAVQNEQTRGVEYELLVPHRTPYPTPEEFAVRFYADYPGMEEIRLSVCEIGRLGQAPVEWRARPNGNRYWTPTQPADHALVAELNPADAPLALRPAGRGDSPRVRASFSINGDRWLCVTVVDLLRKEALLEHSPVVRLR